MNEPTPGDWRPGKRSVAVVSDCRCEDVLCKHPALCLLYGGHIVAIPLNPADVRLIAAAPELLEACRVASVHILHNRDDPADRKRVARQLSAVLGKAKGI